MLPAGRRSRLTITRICALLATLLALGLGSVPPAHAQTITVTTTRDELNTDGDCSLREAIRAANQDAAVDVCPAGHGADMIILPAGTYAITIAGMAEDAAITGDFDITSNLTIMGAAVETTILDANQLDRVLDILKDASVQLTNLTIRNGRPPENADGGGISNAGTLKLRNSMVTNNTVVGAGCGSGGCSFARGAGIANLGVLTVVESILSNNTAPRDGGGITNYGTATFTNSTVSNNSAPGFGGGIYNSGTVRLRASTVSSNRGGAGGGILNDGGTLFLESSTVEDNTEGGGLVNGYWDPESSTATISNSTIRNNRVDGRGGGIENAGTVTISGSTVSENTANFGGGVWNWHILQLSNSTVSGNSALVDGGGIVFAAPFTEDVPVLNLSNTTITGNIADSDHDGTGDGGGIMIEENDLDFPPVHGIIRLDNTLVAANIDRGGQLPDCQGPITSRGYNLIGNATGCTITGTTTGNVLNADPKLGPLAHNRGPTMTHALLSGSPAIDAGNLAAPGSGGSACRATDQRSVARPQDGNGDGRARCDIGAYERIEVPGTATMTVGATECSIDDYGASTVSGVITIQVTGAPVFLTALTTDLQGATGERTSFTPNLMGRWLPVGTTTITTLFRNFLIDPGTTQLRVNVMATFDDQEQQTASGYFPMCGREDDWVPDPSPASNRQFLPIITH